MLLKRIYATPKGWAKVLNVRGKDGKLTDPKKPEGECLNPPPLDHVALAHTGVKPKQNFSDRLVHGALAEGWASISKGKLVLHVEPEELTYTVQRAPGLYCCHCGERQGDQLVARAHVAAAHAGVASPDKANPAGYLESQAYECTLDAQQHDRFRLRAERKHLPPSLHLQHARAAHGKGA